MSLWCNVSYRHVFDCRFIGNAVWVKNFPPIPSLPLTYLAVLIRRSMSSYLHNYNTKNLENSVLCNVSYRGIAHLLYSSSTDGHASVPLFSLMAYFMNRLYSNLNYS